MDNAVALVQAFLRLHGYLTVTEFPVVRAARGGGQVRGPIAGPSAVLRGDGSRYALRDERTSISRLARRP